ncbi:FKBP12-associated protein [Aspergillus melleus]|uniref:FKBP12-associated protein n=1 Tax=Aspergillus melleus TaxID=138277 RepID=A0ACC3B014_9EURO|nr:FKBP12-associated protein [Aspergillus melleus]
MTETISGAPATAAPENTTRSRGPRRGGRGRGNRSHRRPQNQAQAQNSTQNAESTNGAQPLAQPAQPVQPVQQTHQTQPNGDFTPNQPQDASRSRRGPRGGRRGGRGGNTQEETSRRAGRGRGADQMVSNTGRRFEGRLTKSERTSEDDGPDGGEDPKDLELRADAPVFVPGGQPNGNSVEGGQSNSTNAAGKGKGKAKAKAPQQPRPPKVTTKSVAPDIATRIHEDIAHNLYECPILLRAPGAVLGVTWRKKSFPQPILAGVRKMSTRAHFLASLHIRADKPVRGRAKVALIRAMRRVMLGLAPRVLPWVRLRIVSAAGIRLPSVARTPTTRMDGAAVRSAGTCYLVESIPALVRATKVFAARVK